MFVSNYTLLYEWVYYFIHVQDEVHFVVIQVSSKELNSLPSVLRAQLEALFVCKHLQFLFTYLHRVVYFHHLQLKHHAADKTMGLLSLNDCEVNYKFVVLLYIVLQQSV